MIQHLRTYPTSLESSNINKNGLVFIYIHSISTQDNGNEVLPFAICRSRIETVKRQKSEHLSEKYSISIYLFAEINRMRRRGVILHTILLGYLILTFYVIICKG
jgi:hypothetical protein